MKLKNKKKMLENIKSPFIIKKIFSHFHDNIELELIKYNKEFQNALNIDINNPLASPSAGAPELKYGDVNTETTSLGDVKGLK